ncbi:MAG: hypothetical protein V2A79_19835 [Planctomycetota bacterium]
MTDQPPAWTVLRAFAANYCTHKEAARALGISVHTLKSMFARKTLGLKYDTRDTIVQHQPQLATSLVQCIESHPNQRNAHAERKPYILCNERCSHWEECKNLNSVNAPMRCETKE